MHQFRSLCLRLDPHPCHHYFLMPHCNNKICIFESWKNTAHPPIIGAFGHSTDCIVKQPKTATIKIHLYSYNPVLCCHKRNSGLSCRSCMYKQSLVHLVVPKLEELISRTLLGLFKIRLLFQDRVRSQNFRF